jgi:hypothetical protein
MPAKKRKKVATRRVRKSKENEFSKLDQYAIQLNEFYKSLRKAGFDHSLALAIIMDKDAAPNWFLPEVPDFSPIPLDDDEEDD